MIRNRLILALGVVLAVLAAVLAYPSLKASATAVTDVVLARDVDARTCEPRDPRLTFSPKERLHLCVHLVGVVRDETEVSARWYLQQHAIPADTRWKAATSGDGWVQFPIAAGTFEPGEYRVEVLLDGQLKKTLKFTVH